MADENQQTLPEPQSDSSDLLRKIVAAVIGIIVIILIVLAAKWIGDRIRDRFFPSSPTPTSTPTVTQLPTNIATPTITPPGQIPSTGPMDIGYVLIGLSALGGLTTIALSKRRS